MDAVLTADHTAFMVLLSILRHLKKKRLYFADSVNFLTTHYSNRARYKLDGNYETWEEVMETQLMRFRSFTDSYRDMYKV